LAIDAADGCAGQAGESADYVLIAEIVDVERWQQQAERLVQSLADDYLQGIDTTEIINIVHGRRPPVIPASAGLLL
jgi:hypothetical protein